MVPKGPFYVIVMVKNTDHEASRRKEKRCVVVWQLRWIMRPHY